MKLTVLGCYAATPRTLTNPSAQVLEIANELLLIDCGEGTQVQLRKHKIRFSKINHIFISHLHGDHCFGLIGLISTFMLLGREKELHIYGPKGIKEIIMIQLKLSKSWTSYPLYFHELDQQEPQVILETGKLVVETIPLDHRIYTNGFLFREKPRERKLLMDEVQKYDIDVAYFKSIKKGKDAVMEDGTIISNAALTADPEPSDSYAYCSDTAYFTKIVDQIEGVNVLYHESTFLEEHASLAATTKHATAKQAAKIASKANVSLLILGHYSTRYENLLAFRQEALEFFPRIELAEDGKEFLLS